MELECTEEVSGAQTRLTGTGLETTPEDNGSCAYCVQDKVWVNDPDKAPWEIYTVTGDAEEMHGTGGEVPSLALADGVGEGVCCGTGGSGHPGGSGGSSEAACC